MTARADDGIEMNRHKRREGKEGTGTDADGKSGGAESSQAYTQSCPDEWGMFFNIILLH